MLTEPTIDKLRQMRLQGMADALVEQRQSAGLAELTFDERFALLVDAEYLCRANRKVSTLLRKAKLRHANACIEDVDCGATRGLDKATLHQLATCGWVREHHNILITGPTGVGKTYLSSALGQQACRRGYSTLYRRVPRLFDEIALARADGSWPTLLQLLARTDILILDDWGLGSMSAQKRLDLLEVLEDREGLRSTIVTSQLDPSGWHDHVGDPTIADAILDRLLHNAYKIKLTGPSKRRDKNATQG